MNLTIIQKKIYEVRSERIMLDFDIAELYEVKTKRLKEAVRRNRKKFPADFMFELTREEWQNLRTQIASSSWGGLRYMPFAFTEHGVTMIASILNSQKAIEMNIAVVRAFISLRKLTKQHIELSEQLQLLRKEVLDRIGEHDTQLAAIYNTIENLLDIKTEKKIWEERERIGYKK